MLKNKIYLENITIEDFAAEGKCIAKHEGAVVFIEGSAAPGDVVDIEIYNKKKRFFEGRITKIHQYSDQRKGRIDGGIQRAGECKRGIS